MRNFWILFLFFTDIKSAPKSGKRKKAAELEKILKKIVFLKITKKIKLKTKKFKNISENLRKFTTLLFFVNLIFSNQIETYFQTLKGRRKML